MTAKEIKQGRDGQRAVGRGIESTARLAGLTLGPRGALVLRERDLDFPEAVKDGFSAIRNVENGDPFAVMGARLVRGCAKQTRDSVGDGTTTTTLLLMALYREGVRMLAAGTPAREISRTFTALAMQVRRRVQEMSLTCESPALIERVALNAANRDEELATLVAEAVWRLGRDGVIKVSYHQRVTTELDYMLGMKFDHGLVSRDFLGAGETEVKLDEPYLLLCEDRITTAQEVLPALERASRNERSLLVLAEDVTDQALAVLLANHRKGKVRCAAAKGPGSGIYRHAMTSDVAVLTGGRTCGRQLGILPQHLGDDTLGLCKRATVGANNTTILGGAGAETAVHERACQLRDALTHEEKHYERWKLEERIARLTSGVANLRVGAVSESASKERKRRAENAVNAAKAAMSDGVVPGGGVALTVAAHALLAEGHARNPLGQAFARALQEPFHQIARRSGREPALAVEELLSAGADLAFDGLEGTFCRFPDGGIVDAAKVMLTALDNATATACQIIMTDCAIAGRGD